MDFAAVQRSVAAKDVRAHASEVVRAGAALYDALAAEPALREDRAAAVGGYLDQDHVERSVQARLCVCVWGGGPLRGGESLARGVSGCVCVYVGLRRAAATQSEAPGR